MLPKIRPMRLKLVKVPFDSPDYIFEQKYDGFRAIAYQNGECKLISRNNNLLRFKPLRLALQKLPVTNAIIDGEIVSLDKRGVSQFKDLFSDKCQPVLAAFDLLWLDGVDIRKLPLIERKGQLEKLIHGTGGTRMLYSNHLDGDGIALFEEICRLDLEGIVAKRKRSIYKDDGTGWLKIKNPKYSQLEGRREMGKKR
jgi:bifunctional non-homologous end joining protein LigD